MTQVAEKGGFQPSIGRPLPPPPYPLPRMTADATYGVMEEPLTDETGYVYQGPPATTEAVTPPANPETTDVTFDLEHPETIFEAIVADSVMTKDEKLAAIDVAREEFVRAGETRLQVEESTAHYTRHMAEVTANEQKDAVRRQNAAREAEANEKGRQRILAAERDAAVELADAEAQIATMRAEKQVILEYPKKWPPATTAHIRNFNEDRHSADAAVRAVGFQNAAQRYAEDTMNKALDEGRRNLKKVEKAMERLQREQGEIADQILAQAQEVYLTFRTAVIDAYQQSREEILRYDVEQRRRANDPSITFSTSTTRSIPVDLSSLTSADSPASNRLENTWIREQIAEEQPTDDASTIQPVGRTSRVPSFLRGRRGFVAGAVGVVIAISATTVTEIAVDSKPGVSFEFKADEAKAPQWAAPSLAAWQPLITKTAQDPRIAAGKDNYIDGSAALGRGQEQVLYSLMALSSLGDPQYGDNLLGFTADQMVSNGKEIGITYDDTKHDPEQTFVIGEHIINKAIQSMLSDPSKLQAYQHDREKFYQDLAGHLDITGDAASYFVGMNMDATAPESPTFQKLYDQWKTDFDKAAANQKQPGSVPN